MQAYVKGGGPFPNRWFWFVAEEGVVADKGFEDLWTGDVEAYGFALTRWGAQRRARRWLVRIDNDPPLEPVGPRGRE